MKQEQIRAWIVTCMETAERRWGAYRSSHEALGVLIEEVDELREAVRNNCINAIRGEAMQIAAVAERIAIACDDPAFQERSVK